MPRLLFLDWVRIGAFGWLVLYHVGMYYVSWDWHVKSPAASTLIEPLMRLSSPWRMSLLFIVSGAATATMLATPRTGFLRQRSARLLLPLLAGMLLIVPPQSYFEVVQKHGYDGSYLDFMRLYYTGYGGFCRGSSCLMLPTWNHLWFLPYLWCYTVLLWLLLKRWPSMLQDTARIVARHLVGPGLLLWPLVGLAAARLLLFPRFGSTHALLDDHYNHAVYVAMFLFGALLVQRRGHPDDLFERLSQWRRPALALALACWALLALWAAASAGQTPGEGLQVLQRGVRPVLWAGQQWFGIVAVLGFAHRYLDRDHRWRAPLADAVFTVYLLHQTVIVLAAMALRPLGWSPLLEGPLLVAITFAASFALCWLARPFALLRPWLGMSTSPPAAPRRAAAA
jgi:surface polysaccharide O-acyltransferase-like enzyme